MVWPFGGDKKEEEQEETLFQKVTAQVGDYLFSLVVPVSILLYAAPQKSLSYIVDNAKEQVSAISDFDPEVAWNTTLDLINKTVPILQMEGEVLVQAADKSFAYFYYIYDSPWLEMINWQYAAVVMGIFVIILSLFPWGKLIDWVAQSAWRTVMLFVGVLPLDDGLDSLNDKESGTYDVALVAGSIILTLGINYIILISVWWGLKKAILFILSGIASLLRKLLAKQIGWIWTVIKIGVSKLRRKKVVVETERGETVGLKEE